MLTHNLTADLRNRHQSVVAAFDTEAQTRQAGQPCPLWVRGDRFSTSAVGPLHP